MKRYRQSLKELLTQLSPVSTSWQDEHAACVIERLRSLPRKTTYTLDDLAQWLAIDRPPRNVKPKDHFEAGLTTVRLFLDMSKDEFTTALREQLGNGIGITRALRDPKTFFSALEALGILAQIWLRT